MPTPCTEQELMTLSDLVVDATGSAIVCVGTPVDEADKTITTYRSTLVPSKSYKGGLPSSFDIIGFRYEWKGGQAPTGFWVQPAVPKGWVGKLYLKQVTGGTYTLACWNGDIKDTTASSPEPLPQCTAVDGGTLDSQPSDTIASDGIPAGDGSPGGDASPPSPDDGCSCAVGRAASDPSLPLVLFLGILALLSRSRRPR